MSTATETVRKSVSHEGGTVESKESLVAQEGHTVKAKQSLTGSGSGSQLSQQLASRRHPYLPSASDREESVSTRRQAEGTGLGPPVALTLRSLTSSSYCPLLLPSDPTKGLSSSIPVALRRGGGQHRPDPTHGVILRRGLSCPCSAREKTQCWDQERGLQMTAVSSPGVCDLFHTRRGHMHSERHQ